MLLSAFSVIAVAALGGAVAVDLTALVVLAGVVLAVLAVVNGLRTLGQLNRFLQT